MNAKRFDKSRRLLERALRVTPLGGQTYSKSYRYLAGQGAPNFIDRGQAGHVWDVDGNEFVDFILALGPVTIGYNNAEVNEAIVRQLEKGISFSQSTELEIRLAEKLVDVVPCAEMVRFVKNGSDATSAAIRLARAATGREAVAVCGYHGMHDWYIGSTTNRRGIPKCVCDLSAEFRYNDLASLGAVFEQHRGNLAAVIMEPLQGDGPRDDFLAEVLKATHDNGSVLVFDEVVSGFRVALGGAQEVYGVVPDLAAIGKGVANGMPISAIVGRRELLKPIEQGVFVSSTFGGETLSLAAALKTIEILERPGSFEHIHGLARRLMDQGGELAGKKGLGDVVAPSGLPGHCGLVFRRSGSLEANDLRSVFQQRLIQGGILTTGINNFCLEHTEADIRQHLEALAPALDDVARAVGQDSVEGILTGRRIEPIFRRN